jgi:hypothetical protein
MITAVAFSHNSKLLASVSVNTIISRFSFDCIDSIFLTDISLVRLERTGLAALSNFSPEIVKSDRERLGISGFGLHGIQRICFSYHLTTKIVFATFHHRIRQWLSDVILRRS